MSRVTVTQINKAFAERNVPERVAKGKGCFYFFGGDAPNWAHTCVFVTRVGDFDLHGWMREHSRLRGLRREKLFPDYEKYNTSR